MEKEVTFTLIIAKGPFLGKHIFLSEEIVEGKKQKLLHDPKI